MAAKILREILRLDGRDDVVAHAVQEKCRRPRLRRFRDRQRRIGAVRSEQRQQSRAEVDDVALGDATQQRLGRLRQPRRHLADLFKFRRRAALVDAAVERRRKQILPNSGAQRLDLCGGHDAVGDREQDHRDAVIVRRQRERIVLPAVRRQPHVRRWARLLARAQVAEHARQIVVASEREDVRHAVCQGWTPSRDDREPAAEADAHQPDPMVRRERRIA